MDEAEVRENQQNQGASSDLGGICKKRDLGAGIAHVNAKCKQISEHWLQYTGLGSNEHLGGTVCQQASSSLMFVNYGKFHAFRAQHVQKKSLMETKILGNWN